ncbi:MAG: hypothetical protein JWO11_4087 [Nocardioides sp.]|nr:hypothetical protein [Nocardioides sp.]
MTGTSVRVGGRRAAIVIAAIGVFLLGAAPAWAHSELERSDPPNGGMVAIGRSTLTLWFTEAITADASSFDLHTQDGAAVAVTVSMSEAEGGGVVQVEADPLEKATYVLDWRVLSVDGHPSTGSVLFGVGIRPVAPASGSNLPEAPAVLLRWLDLSAIMLAIGALTVSGRVLGALGDKRSASRRRARFTGALAAGVAVVSGAITPLLGTDATWATLADTSWGHLWLAREAALVVAAGALASMGIHADDSRARVRTAAIALTAVALLEARAGHAASLSSGSGLATVASAAHLVAAGIWAGGLAVLAWCLLPIMRRNPHARGPLLGSAWRAYSPRAAIAAVVLLATGLYEAGRQLPDLHSVTSTLYGGAVAGKTALLALALALAGINTLLVHPRLAEPVGRFLARPPGWAPVSLRRFVIVVVAEVVVLCVAVAAAALLTSVPTAREVDTAAQVTAPQTTNADGLFITFEAVPAGRDRSRVIVRAESTVKPGPGPIRGIEVLLVAPDGTSADVTLHPVELGRYEAEIEAPGPGAWEAWVAVQRTSVPDAVATIRWTVRAAAPASAGRLEVTTTALAALLLTGLGGAVGILRRRRLPPATPRDRVTAGAGSRP